LGRAKVPVDRVVLIFLPIFWLSLLPGRPDYLSLLSSSRFLWLSGVVKAVYPRGFSIIFMAVRDLLEKYLRPLPVLLLVAEHIWVCRFGA
jgi:hypothetical protein